jgi:hypothetical protein
MLETKRQLILQTIVLLQEACDDDNVHDILNKVASTVAHTAPEIIDRSWLKLYNVCTHHLNNASIPSHQACFQVYTSQYEKYQSV